MMSVLVDELRIDFGIMVDFSRCSIYEYIFDLEKKFVRK